MQFQHFFNSLIYRTPPNGRDYVDVVVVVVVVVIVVVIAKVKMQTKWPSKKNKTVHPCEQKIISLFPSYQ